MPESAGAVGVVVVNFNSSGHVANCLASLATEEVHSVTVWDNGSKAEDVRELRRVCALWPNVVLVECVTNLGFGAAVNHTIGALRKRDRVNHLWILNPDVIVRPGALRTLLQSVEVNDCSVISPLILMAAEPGQDDRIWFGGGTIEKKAGRSVHTRIGQQPPKSGSGFTRASFISGAAPLISVEAWDQLGGFNEQLFLYCEDADLSIRAEQLGIRMGVESAAVVEHWEGGSSGDGGPGPTFYYYVQRNRLAVYSRFNSHWGLLFGRGMVETARLVLLTMRPPTKQGLRSLRSSLQGVVAGLRGECGMRGSGERWLEGISPRNP